MFAEAMAYYYTTGKKKVNEVESINLQLKNKKDVLYILVALVKSSVSTMVKDDHQIDLIARVMLQASELLTDEELAELQNIIK